MKKLFSTILFLSFLLSGNAYAGHYQSTYKNYFDMKVSGSSYDRKSFQNSNQKAYYLTKSKSNLFNSQLGGKKLGYNNILDISDGISCLKEFKEPTCVIIKHNNPCGVASAKNINLAYNKALKADSISAFGGVLLFNKNIDTKIAKLINRNFFEAIVSPKINKKVLGVLKIKKRFFESRVK